MKNKSNFAKNERGLTLAEVVICTVIVALVVGPITLSYSASTKNRVTAERMNETTNHAENLLRELEDRMTKDMVEWQKIRGNRVDEATLTAEQKYRKLYSSYYINGASINDPAAIATIEAEPQNRQPAGSLFEFLGKGSNADKLVLEEKYNMEMYSYEVIIWPLSKVSLEHISGENYKLKVNNTNLAATTGASKFYSSSDPKFQFDSAFYASEPVSFEIDENVIKGFQDADKSYHMATASNTFTTLNKIKIVFKDNSSDSVMGTNYTTDEGNGNTVVDSIAPILGNGKIVGYEIKIKKSPSVSPSPAGDYLSVVDIDITGLLRNYKGAAADYDDLIFRVVNNTGENQTIRVIENKISTDLAEKNFTFIALGSTDKQNTVQFVSDITTEENYIVAVIIREIKPVIGEKGKIIKKMFDIYSYDPTVIERR